MLQIFQETKNKKRKVKPKRKTWAACPACGHDELLVMGADYLCLSCDWGNARMLVDSDHMDDLEAAAKNQFLTNANIYIQKISKNESDTVEATPVAS